MDGPMSGAKAPSPGWAAREGLPYPLGATWIEEERAYNFALYSKHAEAVVLLLYAEDVANAVRSPPPGFSRSPRQRSSPRCRRSRRPSRRER